MAALALAMALMVVPGRPRSRIGSQRSPTREQRIGVLLGAGVAVAAVAVLVPVMATAAGAVVAASIARRRRGSRDRAKQAEESVALQGALSVLVGELRVGAHPVVAFESAAGEADGTVARSLRAVAARARLGADVAVGLRSVAAHSSVPRYWERLSASWQLAQTHGLAIVAIIRAAERDIVERERFASGVTAGMAGARATAAILAGLPVLGVGLGTSSGRNPCGSSCPAVSADGSCWPA